MAEQRLDSFNSFFSPLVGNPKESSHTSPLTDVVNCWADLLLGKSVKFNLLLHRTSLSLFFGRSPEESDGFLSRCLPLTPRAFTELAPDSPTGDSFFSHPSSLFPCLTEPRCKTEAASSRFLFFLCPKTDLLPAVGVHDETKTAARFSSFLSQGRWLKEAVCLADDPGRRADGN